MSETHPFFVLTELINKFDKLKPSAEYVKDFNPNTPYNQYNDDPDLLEVKSDLYDLFTSFIRTLKELPKVKEVSGTPSTILAAKGSLIPPFFSRSISKS